MKFTHIKKLKGNKQPSITTIFKFLVTIGLTWLMTFGAGGIDHNY